MSKLYDKYIDKKQRIRQLTDELAAIEKQVFAHLVAREIPYQGAGGTLSIANRPSYEYSDTYDDLADRLRKLAKLERETGIADRSDIAYIKYTPNNNL